MASAAAERSWWRRLLLRITTILWFLGGTAFLLSLPIALQASPLIVVAIVVIACGLATLAILVVRLVRRAGAGRAAWLKTAVGATFALTILVASPVYYLATITQVTPAMVPQATLTNGARTIVFQGMQHVGTEPFFKSVVYDLESALSDGYALFYEGVRPANPRDDAWFDRTVTGGADLGTAYRDLAGLCGLRFQNDYFGLLARDARVHPASHVVADVSTADLHAEYDRLMRTDAAFANAMRGKERARSGADSEKPDGLERIVTFMRSGTDGQREIGGVLCRGFMTLVMRKDASADSEDQSEKLILDYRNRVLAQALVADLRPRIYVTYGAKHLPGMLKLLRQKDPRWRIASVKWLRTIDRPDDLTGTIG